MPTTNTAIQHCNKGQARILRPETGVTILIIWKEKLKTNNIDRQYNFVDRKCLVIYR